MKWVRENIFHGKWKEKLSVQLGLLILASNLLFLSICFLFQYNVLGKILQENYEESSDHFLFG